MEYMMCVCADNDGWVSESSVCQIFNSIKIESLSLIQKLTRHFEELIEKYIYIINLIMRTLFTDQAG